MKYGRGPFLRYLGICVYLRFWAVANYRPLELPVFSKIRESLSIEIYKYLKKFWRISFGPVAERIARPPHYREVPSSNPGAAIVKKMAH